MKEMRVYVSFKEAELIRELRGFVEVWQYSKYETPEENEWGRFEGPTVCMRFFVKIEKKDN